MKLLIVRVGAMGDVLHALPAVATLRREKPDWHIDWAIDPRWRPLLINDEGDAPIVNAVHLVPTRDWSSAPISMKTFSSVGALRRAVRMGRYDAVVDMQGTLRSAVIGRMGGAPTFAGYSNPREPLAAALYREKIVRRGVHVIDMGAALLGDALRLTLEAGTFELPHEDWADAWATDFVGDNRVCLLTPGGGWGAKRWPLEKFATLATKLRAAGFDVVVNAPYQHDPVAELVVAKSQGAARVAVCNVSGLIALLRRTTLMIGGDSGPTHLAAALGVPVVALFGPTDPARNGPRGPGPVRIVRHPASPTSYKKSADVDPGLAQVTISDVLAAVDALI